MTDLLIFWLPIVATGILGVGAVFSWQEGYKVVGLWLAAAAIICLIVLFTLQLQQMIQAKASSKDTSPDRAWVAIEVSEHTGITWDEKGARLGINFLLRNTGKSPARNVFFEAKAVLPKIGEPATPVQAMKDYAEDIRRRRATGDAAGEVIFAGNSYPTGMQVLVDRHEAAELLNVAKMPDVLPRIIACASYSAEGVEELRTTCTSYYVITPAKAGSPVGTFRGVSINQIYSADQVGISSAFYSIAD